MVGEVRDSGCWPASETAVRLLQQLFDTHAFSRAALTFNTAPRQWTMALTSLGMSADSTPARAKGSSHDQALVTRVARRCFPPTVWPSRRRPAKLDRHRYRRAAVLRKCATVPGQRHRQTSGHDVGAAPRAAR